MSSSAGMGDVKTAVSELKAALSEIPTVLLDDRLLRGLNDARAGIDALEASAVHHSIVVVVGAGGSGKSSVVNAIVGSEVVAVSPIRPTTTEVTTVGASGSSPLDGETGHLEAGTLPQGLMVIDTPPWDTAERGVRTLMKRAALSVVVVTPSRYADDATREMVAAAKTSRAMCVVANRVPRDMALRDQIQDAVAEHLDIVPTMVITEGDPIVGIDVLRAGPVDGSVVARRTVLVRAVTGASRRIASGLTQAAREVGSLLRVIDASATPRIEVPHLDGSSPWDAVRDALTAAAIAGISSFDDAVEDAHDGELAGRVRAHLGEPEGGPISRSLDAWKDGIHGHLTTKSRFRRWTAWRSSVVQQWLWIVSVDPTAKTPRRLTRVMRVRIQTAALANHDELLKLLQEPIDARREEWRAIVDAAGGYQPGMLLGAADAFEREGVAGA